MHYSTKPFDLSRPDPPSNQELADDLGSLRKEVANLKKEVADLRNRISELNERVEGLQSDK